ERKVLAPGASTTFVAPASNQHGWYDATVLAEVFASVAHYAGRVETGKPSITDPLMSGELRSGASA
ncbi:MAG: hypothetical protein ABI142_11275, partial [Bryocella sp.]